MTEALHDFSPFDEPSSSDDEDAASLGELREECGIST